MADAIRTDQGFSLPAQTLSGTKSTDQQANAFDDPLTMSNDDIDSEICVPGHKVDMKTFATASALDQADVQWEGNQHESNTEVQEDSLSYSQKRKKNGKQAGSIEDDDRNVSNSMEEVLEAHTTAKLPPLSRPGLSSIDAEKSSLARPTEKRQLSPSFKPPSNPAGSPTSSKPSSANQNTSFSLISRANSQMDKIVRQSEGYQNPHHEPEEGPSLLCEAESHQHETMSRTEEHRHSNISAAGFGIGNGSRLLELNESTAHNENENIGFPDIAEEPTDLEYVEILDANEYLQEKPHQADEPCQYPEKYSVALREDIDHLCTAWSKACLAASVNPDTIEHFQSLVSGSEITTERRSALRKELVTNELCRRILHGQREIENLRLESDHKDDVIANYNATSGSPGKILVGDNALRHGLDDWKSLYERMRQRFESLQTQYKLLKTEAEHMYQPYLESTCRDLKADLIEAQDYNAILTEEVRKAQEQAKLWQIEVKQYKEELLLRTEQFDAQSRLQNEEMLGAAKEYHSKVNNSQSWDKDGLILKNKRLEREQAMIAEELSRVLRASANKDDQIENLLKKQQQNQKTIEDLHRACVTGKTTASKVQGDEQKLSVQDVIEEMREKQRQQREDEDTQNVLKEKLRQLRMKKMYPPHKHGWHDLVQTNWQTRWKVDECLEDLTAAEKQLLEQM